MKTALNCPNCLQPFKVTKKCLLCGRYCCSECSNHKICNDCFTKTQASVEFSIYNEDKYNGLVIA